MANTQSICVSFLVEAMTGVAHNLDVDTIKCSLYLATATINNATTAYTATGEVSGTGYTATGATVTAATSATSSGAVAYWTPTASVTWSTVTLGTAFDCALFYNDTLAGDPAIVACTFGSQTVTAADFTLTMPTNDSSNALVRLTAS